MTTAIRTNNPSVSSQQASVNLAINTNQNNNAEETRTVTPLLVSVANLPSPAAPLSITARSTSSERELGELRTFTRDRLQLAQNLQGQDRQEALIMLLPSLLELGDEAKIQEVLNEFSENIRNVSAADQLNLRRQLQQALQGSRFAAEIQQGSLAQIHEILQHPALDIATRAQELMAVSRFINLGIVPQDQQAQLISQIVALRSQLYTAASINDSTASAASTFLQLDHFISQNAGLRQQVENAALAELDFWTGHAPEADHRSSVEKGLGDLVNEMSVATRNSLLSAGSWIRNKISPSQLRDLRAQVTARLTAQRQHMASLALSAAQNSSAVTIEDLRSLAMARTALTAEGQQQLSALIHRYAESSLNRDLFRREFHSLSNRAYSRLSTAVQKDLEDYLTVGSTTALQERLSQLDSASVDSFFRQTLIGHQLTPASSGRCWSAQSFQRASQALQIFSSLGLQSSVRELGARFADQLTQASPNLATARRYRELAQFYARSGLTAEALQSLDALAAVCQNADNRGRGRVSVADQRSLQELAQVVPVLRLEARELNAARLDQIVSRLDAILSVHPENQLARELQTQAQSHRATLRSATLMRVLDAALSHQVGVLAGQGAASAEDLNREKELFLQDISRLTSSEASNRLTVAQAIHTLLGAESGSRFAHIREFFEQRSEHEFNIEESVNHWLGNEDASPADSLGHLVLNFVNANASLENVSSVVLNANLETLVLQLSHSRFNGTQISLSLCTLLQEAGADAAHISTLQGELRHREQMNGLLTSASEMLPIHGEASAWGNAMFLLPFMFGGLTSARIGASLGGRFLCTLAMKSGEAFMFVGVETVVGAAQAYRQSTSDSTRRLAFQNWREQNLGVYNLSKKYLSNLVMFMACHAHGAAFGARIIKPARSALVAVIDRSHFAQRGLLHTTEMALGGLNFLGSTVAGFGTADFVQETVGLREHEHVEDRGTWVGAKALEAFHMDLAGRITGIGALGRVKHRWEAIHQTRTRLPQYGNLFNDLRIDPLSADGGRILGVLHGIEQGNAPEYRRSFHLDIKAALNPEQAGRVLRERVAALDAVYSHEMGERFSAASIDERTRLLAEAFEYEARGHSLERLLQESRRLEFLNEAERERLISRSMNCGIPTRFYEQISTYLSEFSTSDANKIFTRYAKALVQEADSLLIKPTALRRLDSFVAVLNQLDVLHEQLTSHSRLNAPYRQNSRVPAKADLLRMALREKLSESGVRDLTARIENEEVRVQWRGKDLDQLHFVEHSSLREEAVQSAEAVSVSSVAQAVANPFASITPAVNSPSLSENRTDAPSAVAEVSSARNGLRALGDRFVAQAGRLLTGAAAVVGVFGFTHLINPATAQAQNLHPQAAPATHSAFDLISQAGHFLSQQSALSSLATLAFVAGSAYLLKNLRNLKSTAVTSSRRINNTKVLASALALGASAFTAARDVFAQVHENAEANPLHLLAQQNSLAENALKVGVPAAIALGLLTYLGHHGYQFIRTKIARRVEEQVRAEIAQKNLDEMNKLRKNLLNGEVQANAIINIDIIGYRFACSLGNPFKGIADGQRRAIYFDGEKLSYETKPGHMPTLQLWRENGVLFVEGLMGKVYQLSVVDPGNTLIGGHAPELVKVVGPDGRIEYKKYFQFAIKMGAAEILFGVGPKINFDLPTSTSSVRDSQPAVAAEERVSVVPGVKPRKREVKYDLKETLEKELRASQAPQREVLPTIPPLPADFHLEADPNAIVISDIAAPTVTPRRGQTTIFDMKAGKFAIVDDAAVTTFHNPEALADVEATLVVLRGPNGELQTVSVANPARSYRRPSRIGTTAVALLATGLTTLLSIPAHAQEVARRVQSPVLDTVSNYLWGAVAVLTVAAYGVNRFLRSKRSAEPSNFAAAPKQNYFYGLDVQVSLKAGEEIINLSPVSLNDFRNGERKALYLERNSEGTVAFTFAPQNTSTAEKMLTLSMSDKGEVSIVRHAQTIYVGGKSPEANQPIDRIKGTRIIVRSEQVNQGADYNLNFILRLQRTDVAPRKSTKAGLGGFIGVLGLGAASLYPRDAAAQPIVNQVQHHAEHVAHQASEAGNNLYSQHPVIAITAAVCVGLPLVSPLVLFMANRAESAAYNLKSNKTHDVMISIATALRRVGWGMRVPSIVPLAIMSLPLGVLYLVRGPVLRVVGKVISKGQEISRTFFKSTGKAQEGSNILHAIFERVLTNDLTLSKPTNTIYRFLARSVLAAGVAFFFTGVSSAREKADLATANHKLEKLEGKFTAHELPNTVEQEVVQTNFNQGQTKNFENLEKFIEEQRNTFGTETAAKFDTVRSKIVQLTQQGHNEHWAFVNRKQELGEPDFAVVAEAFDKRDEAIRNNEALKSAGISPREYEIILLHRRLKEKSRVADEENRDLMAAYHAEFRYVLDQMAAKLEGLETEARTNEIKRLRKDRILYESICVELGRGKTIKESDNELLSRIRSEFFPCLDKAVSSPNFLKDHPEIRALQEAAVKAYKQYGLKQNEVNVAVAEQALLDLKNDARRKLEMTMLDQEFQVQRYQELFDDLQKTGRLSNRQRHEFRHKMLAYKEANAEYNEYSQRLNSGDPTIRPYAPNAKLRASCLRLIELHRFSVSLLKSQNDSRADHLHLLSFVFKNQMLAMQRGARDMEGLAPITHMSLLLDETLERQARELYTVNELYKIAGGDWGSNQMATYNKHSHLCVPRGLVSYFYQGLRAESNHVTGLRALLGDKAQFNAADVAKRGAVVASLHMGQLEFGISFGGFHLLGAFHNAILAQSGVANFKKVIGPFLGGIKAKVAKRVYHLLGGGAFVSRLLGASEVYETLYRHLFMGNGMNIYGDGTRLIGQPGAPLAANLEQHPNAVLLPSALHTGLNTGMPHKVAVGADRPLIPQTYQVGYIEPSMPMPGSLQESAKAAMSAASRGKIRQAVRYLGDLLRTVQDIKGGVMEDTTMFPYMRLGTEDAVVAYGRPFLPNAYVTTEQIKHNPEWIERNIPNFDKLSTKEKKKALEWLATQMNVALIRAEEIRASTLSTSRFAVQQDWTRDPVVPQSVRTSILPITLRPPAASTNGSHPKNGKGFVGHNLLPLTFAGAAFLYTKEALAFGVEAAHQMSNSLMHFTGDHPVWTILGARWAYNIVKSAFKRADRSPIDNRAETDLPTLPEDLSAWQSVRGSSFFHRTPVENTKGLAEAITSTLRECLGENLSVVAGYGSFPWFSKGKIEAIETRDADKKPDFILVVKDTDVAVEALARQWGWTAEFTAEMKQHARYEYNKSHGFVFFNTDMLIPGQGPVGFKFSMVSEEAFFGTTEGRPHLEYSQIRLKDMNFSSALMYAENRDRVVNHVKAIQRQVLRESLSTLLSRESFSGEDLGIGFFNASYRRHEGYRFWEYGKGADLFKARREVIAPWFAEQVTELVREYNLLVEDSAFITPQNIYDIRFKAPERINVVIDSFSQVLTKNVLGFLTYIRHGLPANKNSRAYYVQDPRQYSGRKARGKYTEGITPFWIPFIRSQDYPAFMGFILSRPALHQIPILGIALRKIATDTYRYPVYFPDLAVHLNNLLAKQKMTRESYDALSREIGNSPVLTKLENEELLRPLARYLNSPESAEAKGVKALFEEILTLPLLLPSIRKFINQALGEEALLISNKRYVEKRSAWREGFSFPLLVGAEIALYQNTHFNSIASVIAGVSLAVGGVISNAYYSNIRRYGSSQIRHLGDKEGVVQFHHEFGEFIASRVADGFNGFLNVFRPLTNTAAPLNLKRRAILVPGYTGGAQGFGELPKTLAEVGYKDVMLIPFAGFENVGLQSHTFVEGSGASGKYLHEYWKQSMRHAITQILREVPEGETVDLVMHSMAGAFFPSLMKRLPEDLAKKIGRVVLSAPAFTQNKVTGRPFSRRVLIPLTSALGLTRKARPVKLPEEMSFLLENRIPRTMVGTEATVRLCENGLRDLALLTPNQMPEVLCLYGDSDATVTAEAVQILRNAYAAAGKADAFIYYDPQTGQHDAHYPYAAPNRKQIVSDLTNYLVHGEVPVSSRVEGKSEGNPPASSGISGSTLLTLGAMSTFLTGFTNTESLAAKAIALGIGVSIAGKEICDRLIWPRLRQSFIDKAQERGVETKNVDVSGQALAPLREIISQFKTDFAANKKIVIPNGLTAMAIVSALGACAAAITRQPLWASLGLTLAPALDGIDGTVARRLKATSRTGELSDDFADNLNNGAIVGTLAGMHLALQGHGVMGVIVAAAFTVAIRTRLSLFRLLSDNETLKPTHDALGNKHYENGKGFLGVASPVAAMSVLGLYNSVQNSPHWFFAGCMVTAASLVDWMARPKIAKTLSFKEALTYMLPGAALSVYHQATDTPMDAVHGVVDVVSGAVATFSMAYIAHPYAKAAWRKLNSKSHPIKGDGFAEGATDNSSTSGFHLGE